MLYVSIHHPWLVLFDPYYATLKREIWATLDKEINSFGMYGNRRLVPVGKLSVDPKSITFTLEKWAPSQDWRWIFLYSIINLQPSHTMLPKAYNLNLAVGTNMWINASPPLRKRRQGCPVLQVFACCDTKR